MTIGSARNPEATNLPRQLCWPTDGVGLSTVRSMSDAGQKRRLAEMIGTTRSRVSHFMNKFRKLGLIDYNGHIEVHNSLLSAVLNEKPHAQGIKSSTALTGRRACTSVRARKRESSTYVIDFPNHSRSYDSTRRAVRFWGHDSAIEASFFISEDALRRIQPDARPDEPGFLNAFDSNRDLICAAAAKLYVRGSRGSYDLVAANF